MEPYFTLQSGPEHWTSQLFLLQIKLVKIHTWGEGISTIHQGLKNKQTNKQTKNNQSRLKGKKHKKEK